MEPPRGRGRPSGARESQLFFGYDSPPPRGAGPSPGGRLSTLPARRVGHGTRSFAGTSYGCCVSGTWRHSEAAGGRVELESRSCFLRVLYVTKMYSKDPFGHHHYHYRGALYNKDTWYIRINIPCKEWFLLLLAPECAGQQHRHYTPALHVYGYSAKRHYAAPYSL